MPTRVPIELSEAVDASAQLSPGKVIINATFRGVQVKAVLFCHIAKSDVWEPVSDHLVEGKPYIVLHQIKAEPTGTLRGKAVLRYLCRQADLAGIGIELDVETGRDEPERLVQYYKRSGFQELSGCKMWRATIPGVTGVNDGWLLPLTPTEAQALTSSAARERCLMA